MKDLCRNTKVKCYRYYGGRGIAVCMEWLEYLPFHDWAMANGYADDLTLDRIDGDGGYRPDNCRWATMSQQCAHTDVRTEITIEDELLCVSWDLAIEYSATDDCLRVMSVDVIRGSLNYDKYGIPLQLASDNGLTLEALSSRVWESHKWLIAEKCEDHWSRNRDEIEQGEREAYGERQWEQETGL